MTQCYDETTKEKLADELLEIGQQVARLEAALRDLLKALYQGDVIDSRAYARLQDLLKDDPDAPTPYDRHWSDHPKHYGDAP